MPRQSHSHRQTDGSSPTHLPPTSRPQRKRPGPEAPMTATELRRSKRSKTTAKRPNTVTSYGGELSTEDLALLANQLPRNELEQLVVRLAKESVDCGEIIQMEIGNGLLAKPVTNFPTTTRAPGQLGNLAKLPIELITEILRYVPVRDRLIFTSQVCKTLQKFRWLKPLWTSIDTQEVPYSTLFETILPALSEKIPGSIKEANVVYKTNSLPKAEKLLGILARYHQLDTLKLTQLTAPVTHKKVESLRKMVEDYPGLAQIKHFSIEILMDLSRDYAIVHAERAIDLVALWPSLRSFSLRMPGGRDRLNMVYWRRLSETGAIMKPGPRTMAKNYLTSISLSGGIMVDAEIFLQFGNLFPELEHLLVCGIIDYGTLDGAIADCENYDTIFPPLRRLRTCDISFKDTRLRQANPFSVLFFSIMKNSPWLVKYVYSASEDCHEKMPLFEAIRTWPGGWTGVNPQKLQHLVMRNWALEWKLLSYKGVQCNFPAIVKTEAPGCICIETSNLVNLLKNGGRA